MRTCILARGKAWPSNHTFEKPIHGDVSVHVRHRTDRGCRARLPCDRRAYRVPTMKHPLQLEVIKVMPSYHVRGNPGGRAAAQDSARIQGGNWSMQGFRRSGHVHDEGECQMSIA